MSDALGRITLPDGRVVSARLIERLNNPETAVEATLEDVAEIIQSPMGGRRKMRGGDTKTVTALKNMMNAIKSAGSATASKIDELGAVLVTAIPIGVSVRYGPTVLGNIASFIRQSLPTSAGSWGTYLPQVKSLVAELGGLGINVAALTMSSPEIVIILTAIIQAYRANQSNMSIFDRTKEDASVVTSSAMRGITGEIQGFNDAWSKEALKKATDTLRSIGKNVQVVPAERKPGDPIDVVGYSGPVLEPDYRRRSERIKQSIGRIPSKKGGKRKTKKSKKVGRSTRRKTTFSY